MLLTLFKNTNQLSSLVCEVKASPRHVVWLGCSHRQRVWTGQDRPYFVQHVSLLQPITEQITVSGLTQWRIARSSPIQNGETNRLVTLKSLRIHTSVYVPIRTIAKATGKGWEIKCEVGVGVHLQRRKAVA